MDASQSWMEPLDLYDLDDELEALKNALVTARGELTVEMEQQFDVLDAETPDDVERLLALIRSFDVSAEAVGRERARLERRENTLHAAADALKKRLAAEMQQRRQTVLDTKLGRVRLQEAGQRAVVLDVDIDDLPERFRRVAVTPNKEALHDALESEDPDERDEAAAYAHLDEPSYYVRIY